MKRYRVPEFVTTCLLAAFVSFGCGDDDPAHEPAEPMPGGVEVAVLETDFGDITLGFLPDVAPRHVENFKTLVREGFYDGTKFHRVAPRFMIQGGCPNTKGDDWRKYGLGNPGYSIPPEFSATKHVRGTLSMARGDRPDSAGSQFFICVARTGLLDGKYTVFGFVISGLDAVDKIVNVPTKNNAAGENSLPAEPVHLKRAYLKYLPEEQAVPEGAE